MDVSQNTSPFFKVRKILILLRLFLGFPLKPVNNEFVEFAFKPCLEYPRYAMHMFIAAGAAFFTSFLFMKNGNHSDPFAANLAALRKMGLSLLDMSVMQFIPLVSYVSCFFYIHSFKKLVKNINKISIALSCLHKELVQPVCPSIKNPFKKTRRSMRLLCIGIMVCFIGCSCWSCMVYFATLEGVMDERYILKTEVIPVVMVVGI